MQSNETEVKPCGVLDNNNPDISEGHFSIRINNSISSENKLKTAVNARSRARDKGVHSSNRD